MTGMKKTSADLQWCKEIEDMRLIPGQKVNTKSQKEISTA